MSVAPPDPDHEAMQRLQAGESLALNELMNRWKQPLVSYLYRQLGHEQDALDLAQETFVRVYQQAGRYRPHAKFSTWLFTIASNLAKNRHRWRARHPAIPLEEAPEPSIPTTENEEHITAVQQAIAALPHDLKTAVLLSEYHDLPQNEIAAILGCTRKAVETRLARARQFLRAKLKPS